MKLLQIPPEVTDSVWGAVEPFMAMAVAASRDTCTVESTHERIKANAAQLWLMVEDEKPHRISAAGVTSIVDYPSGIRALMLELLGGHNLKQWFVLKGELEEWAIGNGCTLFYCWARKGLARQLEDFQITHYVMKKTLSKETRL